MKAAELQLQLHGCWSSEDSEHGGRTLHPGLWLWLLYGLMPLGAWGGMMQYWRGGSVGPDLPPGLAAGVTPTGGG